MCLLCAQNCARCGGKSSCLQQIHKTTMCVLKPKHDLFNCIFLNIFKAKQAWTLWELKTYLLQGHIDWNSKKTSTKVKLNLIWEALKWSTSRHQGNHQVKKTVQQGVAKGGHIHELPSYLVFFPHTKLHGYVQHFFWSQFILCT